MRLLVVDDDPSVREALGLVLDLNGFGFSTATDGAEAIRTTGNSLSGVGGGPLSYCYFPL